MVSGFWLAGFCDDLDAVVTAYTALRDLGKLQPDHRITLVKIDPS